jgi:hypothetical protein
MQVHRPCCPVLALLLTHRQSSKPTIEGPGVACGRVLVKLPHADIRYGVTSSEHEAYMLMGTIAPHQRRRPFAHSSSPVDTVLVCPTIQNICVCVVRVPGRPVQRHLARTSALAVSDQFCDNGIAIPRFSATPRTVLGVADLGGSGKIIGHSHNGIYAEWRCVSGNLSHLFWQVGATYGGATCCRHVAVAEQIHTITAPESSTC